MAQNFAGYSVSDMSAFLGIPPAMAEAVMALANQQPLTSAQQTSLQAIPPSAFANIEAGLQHDVEHPKGSHYHGDIDIGRTIGDLTTFGAYSAVPKIAQGHLSSLGDFGIGPLSGSFARDVGGELGHTIQRGLGTTIAGAGIGSALTAPGEAASVAGGVSDLGPGAMVGVNDSGEALYLVKTAQGVQSMTALEAASAGIPEMTAGGSALGAVGGTSGTSAGTGAMLGAQGAQMFLGQQGSPQQMVPQGGAYPGGGPGGLTPQQVAALSAMNSEAHRGLAPSFESRMRGTQQSPGIAGNAFIQ